ncbi:HK97 gp10 family phage protein [Ochrobactrum vermis]|uniref:HK97 gp10 family phage protein n=1 Tax=Ochrobactrum vermis TaxID=1827297 RepID=A0ABU8PG48_9HYPH|nr:HK97 gp10 family phage protein [Ochrobactrum vermis]PQZ30925.1 hypothetical protein CQZ93_13075 [Ochrobactrum vermis]
MAIKATIQGREALNRRLRQLVPDAEKNAAEAKLQIANEAANAIAAKAPIGPATDPFTGKPRQAGKYRASIKGGLQRDNAGKIGIGQSRTKDPDATGVYAEYIWRFLEFGTKPHINKGAAPGTHHPGTAKQPHIFPTWRAMQRKAKRRVRDAINKAVRKARGK